MNKYVDELPEENGKSVHYEEMVASTGKPVATKQLFVPIDQRSGKTFLPSTSSMGDPCHSVFRRQ